MDFLRAVGCFFCDYANFRGRASSSTYWWSVLFVILALAAASAIDNMLSLPGIEIIQDVVPAIEPVCLSAALFLLLPFVTLNVRRLHDIGGSGWWFLAVLTGIGAIVLLFLFILEEPDEEDRYGSDPGNQPVWNTGTWKIYFRQGLLSIGQIAILMQTWFIAQVETVGRWFTSIHHGCDGTHCSEWWDDVLPVAGHILDWLKSNYETWYYGWVDGFLNWIGIPPSHTLEDIVWILAGTAFMAYRFYRKIAAARLAEMRAKARHENAVEEFEDEKWILGGALVGLMLLGPIGAVAGSLFGAAVKKVQLDEVSESEIAAEQAKNKTTDLGKGLKRALLYDTGSIMFVVISHAVNLRF